MNWNPSVAIPLLIGLFLFGVIFALIVHRLGNKHFGYTSLLVVIGVAVTVVASFPIIGWQSILWVFLAFAASGTPMIAGDAIKGAKDRQDKSTAQSELLQRLADRGIDEAGEVNIHETPTAR